MVVYVCRVPSFPHIQQTTKIPIIMALQILWQPTMAQVVSSRANTRASMGVPYPVRTPTWGEWLSGIQCKVPQQQTKHHFLIHYLNLVCMMIYVIRILTLSKYHICFGNMRYRYIFRRTFFQKWPWNRGILCRCVPGIPAARFCASLVGFKKCDIRPVKVDEISTYPFIYTNNPSEKRASSDSDAVCRPCI